MKTLKTIILFLIFSGFVVACDSWLEVQPYDTMAEDELLGSEEGFKKLLNGVYIDLCKDELYGRTLTVEMVEILGGSYLIGEDPMIWGDYIDLDNRNFTSAYWRGRLDATWNTAYALIRNCNTLLEQAESRGDLFTGDNYNLIRGEALALRALLHFDMFRLFGPVYKLNPERKSIPYVVSTSLQVQEFLPGDEVMSFVIADLKEAERLLADDPIIGTTDHLANHGGTVGSNFLEYRTLRLNYYAVQALLARAYHYISSHEGEGQTEFKAEAKRYAEAVLSVSGKHFPFVDKANILGSPQNVDRIFATEVIFALTDMNRNRLFKDNNDPERSPKPVLRMNPALLEEPYFGGSAEYGGSTDDYRYIANWKKNGNDYYFYKYADMNAPGRIENTMVPMVRLGEMFLIIADLYDGNGERPLMGAWANRLRAVRGVDAMDESSYAPRFLNYEVVRELYGEGQIFFHYKRNYSAILTVFEAPSQFKLPSEKLFVVPLPDTEMDNRQ